MYESSKPSGPLLMSQVVMLVGGLATAGMACATWRAVNTAIDHNATVIAVQQQQQQQLVDSIRTLAEHTGMLTSADLCPIRFRIRCDDGHFFPVLPPAAALEWESEDGFTLLNSIRATTAGTIDFGLNPPGRYRVSVTMDDGMHLQHLFEVLPGVPVDRLINCPDHTPTSALLQLEVDWPEPLDRHELLAVCRLEPRPVSIGSWAWQPAAEWHEIYGLVCSMERELPASDLFLLEQLLAMPEEFNGELQPGAGVTVPFRFVRLSQITFLGRFAETEELTLLGTAIFAPEPAENQSHPTNPTTWYCQDPPPTYEFKHVPGNWTIRLPDDVVEELLQRIER